MSNENYSDEIDMMQIFGMIKGGFRNFLRLIISVIAFYKKKAILFLALLILGTLAGYLLDKYRDKKDNYIQEIVIEPKYNSTKYIYDFVEELDRNFKDDVFLKKLGINPEGANNLKEIIIEPVVKGTDVLDNLQERYENREYFNIVIDAYEDEDLKNEKFRDFYKHHKLVFKFKNKNTDNTKIAVSILAYLKSNKYYSGIADLTIQQNKIGLEENKTTLKFVDQFLMNLSKNPPKTEKGIVIVKDDNDDMPVVTVASLLKQKESLMEIIYEQERVLAQDREMISIVDYGDIISARKKLFNRMLIIIPIEFFVLVSLFFFLRYLYREIKIFVEDE